MAIFSSWSPRGPRPSAHWHTQRGRGPLACVIARSDSDGRLQHLEHPIDRALGQAVAEAEEDEAVEPAVFLRRGFERPGNAQIIVRRLDHFAAGDAVEHLLGAVADAGVRHADDLIVVGLEDDAHIEHPGAVAVPDRLPIAAAGQERAGEPLALEAAAGNDADPPIDTGRLA